MFFYDFLGVFLSVFVDEGDKRGKELVIVCYKIGICFFYLVFGNTRTGENAFAEGKTFNSVPADGKIISIARA